MEALVGLRLSSLEMNLATRVLTLNDAVLFHIDS